MSIQKNQIDLLYLLLKRFDSNSGLRYDEKDHKTIYFKNYKITSEQNEIIVWDDKNNKTVFTDPNACFDFLAK